MGLHPDLLNPVEVEKVDSDPSGGDHSYKSDLILDQNLLEAVEQAYYGTDVNFDPLRYELNKLSPTLNSKEIEQRYKRLKQQHDVVSKTVLRLILRKQNACKGEFEKVLMLQKQLQDMINICRVGRTDLLVAKSQFTTTGLGVLANYRKRLVVQELLSNLSTIKTLQQTEDHLQELLNEGNYPGAISLVLECQSAAITYKHFNCIAVLEEKLQDVLEQTEEELDVMLSKMCTQFDMTTYSSIQGAYKLLGKMQTAMDQLHMYFTAAIHNTAFAAVYRHVSGDMKKPYKELCQSVSDDKFIPCLIDLCKSLWTILTSYYLVVNWHNKSKMHKNCDASKKDAEATFNKQYIDQKLENGMVRIWHDIEMKISTYLIGTDLTCFPFEHFVQILGIVHRLMEVGEELCASRSESLQKSIRKQCLSFFSHYHASRLDELRIFLENDGWKLCPVKTNFTAIQLQEFRSLNSVFNNSEVRSSPEGLNFYENDNSGGWLQRCVECGVSPFEVSLDETIDEDILAIIPDDPSEYFSEDSDDELPEELKREYVEESDHLKVTRKKTKVKHIGPMVTNTTLSILRVCGRYLQMSRLLQSIAVAVIQSMIEFFELCFYAVHSFFTADLQINGDLLYSPKLKLTLARIKENLIVSEHITEEVVSQKYKVIPPKLSSTVNLKQPEKVYGLAERIVAVESLLFLRQQFISLRPYLEHLTDGSQHEFLHQFYTQTLISAVDLRKPIYMAAISQAFDTNAILNSMSKVNWEVQDVMSQHSAYVDTLLYDVQVLSTRLAELGSRVPLSREVSDLIWENVAQLVACTLVEGFSNAKKCTNGGRALMQLDFTQLRSKFEKLTALRPMPHSQFVEQYVKAFYLPEISLEEWVQEHKEYTLKHLTGLISCTCQNSKKARQRLMALIEEQRINR
ncbi:syndetin isoform X2 [Orussus abietinus]|nr:syndetin isoform X2 [Orussus abietinus]